MYEIEEITRYKVEGVVKGRRLLRTGPRTLDGKPATPITQFVVTRDGEQISEAYATREEAEEELALRRNARKG